MERSRVQISSELLEVVRILAEKQGRSEAEVLQDAVLRYLRQILLMWLPEGSASIGEPVDEVYVEPHGEYPLGSGDLGLLLDRIARGQRERGVEPLSEDEAVRLANEELHAMRRERRSER